MADRSNRTGWKNPVVLDFANRQGHPEDPVEAARVAVGELLEGTDADAAGRPWASDLWAVSASLGLNPSTRSYGGIDSTARMSRQEDGSLKLSIGNEGRAAVGDDGRHNWSRTRFSIAHELGHLLIRRGGRQLRRRERLLAGDTQREEETLCNLIASEILMPTGRLARFVDANTDSGRIEGELLLKASRAFEVSRIVAANRLAMLWPEGVALYWTMSPHPRSPDGPSKLRVCWAYPLAPLRDGTYVPYHATAKLDRIRPNLPADCYEAGRPMSGTVEVRSFGGLRGAYDAIAVDLRDNGLFGTSAPRRGSFDIVTVLRRTEAPPSSGAAEEVAQGGQLELFRRNA